MRDRVEALQVVTLAARTILECSGEIYRAEDTVRRISAELGFETAEVLCFPTGFTLTVTTPDGESTTRTVRVSERSIQLAALDEVNRVSRAVVDDAMTAPEALQALKSLRSRPAPNPWFMALAYALSAGFFSVMFSGGVREFAFSFLAGFLLQAVMPHLRRWNAPTPLLSLAGGMLAAGLSLLVLAAFGGGNQEAVIAGVIMPLLPGLAMTNAVRDTMRGDLVAGMARSTEALLSAVMLAAGVAIVIMGVSA